jgi:ferritin-like metal-binding protein YciE
METVKDLPALLMHYIQNLYAAEEQMIEMLTIMIEKARHRSLKNALQHHLALTIEHKKRLRKIPGLINGKNSEPANTKRPPTSIIKLNDDYISKGMKGLVEEAKELLDAEVSEEVTDAAIIGCVQLIEHYEICAYGTAIAYAKQLHFHEVEKLLKESLNEEYDNNDLLTALATAGLNKEAVPEGMEAADEAKGLSGGETTGEDHLYTGDKQAQKGGSERTINSPGGRAGTSHRGYSSGESRGH